MPRVTLYTSCLLLFIVSSLWAQDGMTNDRLKQVLEQEAEKMEGEAGSWVVYYGARILVILADEDNNRMRIFTPIVDKEKLTEKEMFKMLEANFHRALDAKYGLYDSFVVSVFTHPLAELTRDQLSDALRQVVALADTFGSTYSSTDLVFGGNGAEEGIMPDEKRINQSPSKIKN